MTQIALDIIALNLWAMLVCSAAAALSRRASSLAAWPEYWIGAMAVILAPWLAALLAPDAALSVLGAGLEMLASLVETPAAAPAIQPSALGGAAAGSALPTVAAAPTEPPFPAAILAASLLRTGFAAFVAVYAAGALWVAGRHVAAHVRLRLLARRAQPLLTTETAHPVRLIDAAAPPSALGFPAPCVLIPARIVKAIAPAELAMILRHEAAHIDRRDPELTLLLGLIGAVFWPNPAVRALIDRWRLAAEMRADAAVAAGRPQADRLAYAHLLVSALRNGRAAPLAAPSAALRLDQKGSVKMRLAAILDASMPAGGAASRLLAGVAGVSLAAAGGLGCAVIAQAVPEPRSDALALMVETSEPPLEPARAEGPVRPRASWDLLAGLSRDELAPICESGEPARARALQIACLNVGARGTGDLLGAPVAFMSSSGFLYYGDLAAADLDAARARLESQRDAIAALIDALAASENGRREALVRQRDALERELADWEVAGWVTDRAEKT